MKSGSGFVTDASGKTRAFGWRGRCRSRRHRRRSGEERRRRQSARFGSGLQRHRGRTARESAHPPRGSDRAQVTVERGSGAARGSDDLSGQSPVADQRPQHRVRWRWPVRCSMDASFTSRTVISLRTVSGFPVRAANVHIQNSIIEGDGGSVSASRGREGLHAAIHVQGIEPAP